MPVAQVSSVERNLLFVNADTSCDDNTDVAFRILNETRNAVMSGFKRRLKGKETGIPPGSFLATPVFESFHADGPGGAQL
jgi:hypothetical protein